MSQMGNLEKLGILVIVILVVVVGVVVITPKGTLFPEDPAYDGGLLPVPLDDSSIGGPTNGGPAASGPETGTPENPTTWPLDESRSSDVAVAPPGPAIPGPAPSPPSAPQFKDYVIQKDDTLEKIAKRELGTGSRWPEIVSANPGLDPKKLRLKQVIRIPVATDSSALPPGVPPTTTTTPLVAAGQVPPVTPPAGSSAGTAAPPPAPPVGAAPAPTASERTYVVRSGDTLSDIARREMGSASKFKQLAEANRDVLKGSDVVVPGMKLRIPGSTASSSGGIASTPVATPAPSGITRTYTVQKGDTLSSIASRMLGSSGRWREIQRANETVLKGGDDIAPGMVLTIPADVSAR